MVALLERACGRCGRIQPAQALVCALCGDVFRREELKVDRLSVAMTPRAPVAETWKSPSEVRALAEPWIYFAIGLVGAPLFALTPWLQLAAWFLSSLVHEMGHAAFAWLCGMPSVPAISLDGHAAAMHGEQMPALAGFLWIALGFGAWNLFSRRWRIAVCAALAVVLPSLAFTGARDVVFLFAGHGAELAFAALALWKALDGGFTHSKAERALYSTVGWLLLWRNAKLCWGLFHSALAREQYRGNGSFGLTNDYVRLADELLGWPVERVATLMLVACLLVVPLALLGWRVSKRWREAA